MNKKKGWKNTNLLFKLSYSMLSTILQSGHFFFQLFHSKGDGKIDLRVVARIVACL